MDITIHSSFLPHDDPDASLAFYRDILGFEVRLDVGYEGMRWITVGPPDQPDTSIVLHPPGADPGITDEERRTITEMMAKGTYGSILLATRDLDGTFEQLQASDAEVVQEPTEQPYGVRDCAVPRPRGQHGPHPGGPLTVALPDARDSATRKTDTLTMLATPAIDVWVATASAAGAPYLVPVSLAWVDERVVIAVDGTSLTARNLAASGVARLALGPTRDFVMIDAVLDKVLDVAADDGAGGGVRRAGGLGSARQRRLPVPGADARSACRPGAR